MVIIRFKTPDDGVNGYYLLALKGAVRGLRDGLYEINDSIKELIERFGATTADSFAVRHGIELTF